MILNVHLNSKVTDYDLSRCYVAVVVELSGDDFRCLQDKPLDYYDFITGNLDKLQPDNSNIHKCIMLLNEENDDGILVDPQGYNYARYSAYIPNAKQLVQLQYPCLEEFNDRMRRAVDKYVGLALENQKDGKYTFDINDVNREYDCDIFDSDLFVDMIGERSEFSDVEYYGGEFTVKLANNLRNGKKRELSQRDVDVICAQHILWLNDAGGEKADFSNCVLKGLNLYGKSLSNSDCSNAVFDGCNLQSVDFSNAEVESAKFEDCCMEDIFANKTNFIQAEFIECDISNSVIMGSLLISATMKNCDVKNTQITGCQIDGFSYPETYMEEASCFDEQSNEQDGFMTLS